MVNNSKAFYRIFSFPKIMLHHSVDWTIKRRDKEIERKEKPRKLHLQTVKERALFNRDIKSNGTASVDRLTFDQIMFDLCQLWVISDP